MAMGRPKATLVLDTELRGQLQNLVTFNRASFFFDNGRPHGMTYDVLVDFEPNSDHPRGYGERSRL